MTQLIIDYGDVISLPQREADLNFMAVAAGIPLSDFVVRYRECRSEYERGQSALGYWTEVLGGPPGGQLLAALVERDVSSWLKLNPSTLQMVGEVHASGVPVSLMANVPRELARELDRHPELAGFTHRFFSADMQLIKPEPEAYRAVLDKIGADPADVVLVDDRLANVEAAGALGLRAIHFTGTPTCVAAIREEVGLPARPTS
jgi:putative hydrolase of the HAD superfamily